CLFFQAEDGIRDGHVTGVQTCALPISRSTAFAPRPATNPIRRPGYRQERRPTPVCAPFPEIAPRTAAPSTRLGTIPRDRPFRQEIGRASCRERVSTSVVDVRFEQKSG